MATEVRGPGGMASIFELTKEIKMDPDNALLLAERSECFRIVQQYYHAVKDADRIISVRPKWYKGYYLKGLALHGAGNYKSALETFEDGLEYSSNEHLITAMQNANRGLFRSRLNRKCYAAGGFFLGCGVGFLALCVNDFFLPKPVVANVFLKVCIIGMWSYFGLESGKNFSKMLQESCEKRLQAPEELFPFTKDSGLGKKKSVQASIGTSTEGLTNGGDKTRTRQGTKSHRS